MRALVKTGPGRGMELLDVDDPVPGTNEVLIEVEASGVCGSDIARFEWSRNYEAGAAKDMTKDLPRVLGHEFAGVVRELGSQVSTLSPGDRVAVQNILGCGRCRSCQDGSPNVCSERRTIGVHRDGGYAELCSVPAANCAVIDDGVSMHLAAALQPFAVATHAVEISGVRPGDRALIWGLGPIGLAVAAACRLRGVEIALGTDVNPVKLQQASDFGVPVISAATGSTTPLEEHVAPRSIDAVFEAAGAREAIESSLPLLAKNRPIILIGNQRHRTDADLMPLIMDQQSLLGSRSYSLSSWDIAVRTIGRSGYARTLGEEVSLDESLERFEMAARGGGGAFTIMPQL